MENWLELITDWAKGWENPSTQAVITVPSGAGSPFSFAEPTNTWGKTESSMAGNGTAIEGGTLGATGCGAAVGTGV